MRFDLSTAGLTRSSVRHPWRAIGAWAAFLAVAFVLITTLLGNTLTTELSLTNNPESVQADESVARAPRRREHHHR